MRMRRRAVRALMSHTQNAIRDLRNDEDEMLRGRAQPFGSQEASHLHNAAGISAIMLWFLCTRLIWSHACPLYGDCMCCTYPYFLTTPLQV